MQGTNFFGKNSSIISSNGHVIIQFFAKIFAFFRWALASISQLDKFIIKSY